MDIYDLVPFQWLDGRSDREKTTEVEFTFSDLRNDTSESKIVDFATLKYRDTATSSPKCWLSELVSGGHIPPTDRMFCESDTHVLVSHRKPDNDLGRILLMEKIEGAVNVDDAFIIDDLSAPYQISKVHNSMFLHLESCGQFYAFLMDYDTRSLILVWGPESDRLYEYNGLLWSLEGVVGYYNSFTPLFVDLEKKTILQPVGSKTKGYFNDFFRGDISSIMVYIAPTCTREELIIKHDWCEWGRQGRGMLKRYIRSGHVDIDKILDLVTGLMTVVVYPVNSLLFLGSLNNEFACCYIESSRYDQLYNQCEEKVKEGEEEGQLV